MKHILLALILATQLHAQHIRAKVADIANMDGIRFVDQNNTGQWAGSDICGWIQSAGNDLPASGGRVQVQAGVALNCLGTTGPLVDFSVNGKCITVAGEAGQAVYLGFPNLNVGPAFQFDCKSNNNQHPIGFGIRDLYLQSNSLGTSIGVQFNNVNSGEGGTVSNTTIIGFATGIFINGSGGQGSFNNMIFNTNIGASVTQAIDIQGITEGIKIMGGVWAGNAKGLNINTAFATEAYIYGVDCDGSAPCIFINGTPNSLVDCTECHFENPGANTAVNYGVVQNGTLILHGGDANDDVSTSTSATNWFSASPAGYIMAFGTQFNSSGRTNSTCIFGAGGTGRVYSQVIDLNTTALPNIFCAASLAAGNVVDLSWFGTHANLSLPGAIQQTGVAFSALGSATAGMVQWCSDCQVTTAASCATATPASCVCKASGNGAFARGMNYQGNGLNWYCQ